MTEDRLAALGVGLVEVRTVPHTTPAVAGAVAGIAGDLVLVLTGSATSDLHDVGPE
ncbi:MAG: molybdopterin biosynthesis protein, partial [Rhodobacteraceae bacterium]|nr:molybdopterin biosynthesis protein [Paracoccaceae bacterium]